MVDGKEKSCSLFFDTSWDEAKDKYSINPMVLLNLKTLILTAFGPEFARVLLRNLSGLLLKYVIVYRAS